MTTQRVERVAQAIQEETAQILQRELKDPRVGFVTVTRVRLSADLQHATIYYSVMEGQGNRKETTAGLRSAQGFVRRMLGERLRLRVTPEIRFEADASVEESIRISRLLSGLKKDSE